MNHLQITIAASPEEAPDYKKTSIRSVSLTEAIIVCNGMKSGKSSVDLRFKATNKRGQAYEFVAMTTGELLQSLASVIKGAEVHTTSPA